LFVHHGTPFLVTKRTLKERKKKLVSASKEMENMELEFRRGWPLDEKQGLFTAMT
jgi:hypothetical protein